MKIIRLDKRHIILIAIFFLAATAFSQNKPLDKRIILKTNILSLIAKRPTISIEKAFSKTFSTEISFVQGEFNNFLFTDHYDYNGFLIRFKKYLEPTEYSTINAYFAGYMGNLKRNIQTEGQSIGSSGFFGYPSRDFSSNSLRFGGSFGLLYVTKSRIVIDGQASLGYGRYLNIDKADPSTYSRGFLDTQIWLSIGYSF